MIVSQINFNTVTGTDSNVRALRVIQYNISDSDFTNCGNPSIDFSKTGIYSKAQGKTDQPLVAPLAVKACTTTSYNNLNQTYTGACKDYVTNDPYNP